LHKDSRCKAAGGAHLKPRRNSLEGIWVALAHMYYLILVSLEHSKTVFAKKRTEPIIPAKF
jgi:hypothetical protein